MVKIYNVNKNKWFSILKIMYDSKVECEDYPEEEDIVNDVYSFSIDNKNINSINIIENQGIEIVLLTYDIIRLNNNEYSKIEIL